LHILIYGLNYAPELTGIGKYTGEMAEWLVAEGHSVRVITAPMYYPAWRIGDGFSARRYTTETREGAIIIRCPLYVPKKPSGVKRLIHLFSFAMTSFPVLLWQTLRSRPDVIITVAPTFFCTPAAWLCSLVSGAHSWLHLQDLEVDAAFELGLLPRWLRAFALTLEGVILRRFSRVSTISQRMLDRLANKGVAEKRLVLFRNWVNTDQIRPSAKANALRDELHLPDDKRIVLYSGNMGEKQGLEIILQAARELSARTDIQFVLCGDGSVRSQLEQGAAGLAKVIFLPLQPANRVNELLNLADIHLLVQRPDAADLVMPSKLSAILACGGAVIATAAQGSEIAHVVQHASGLLCTPGNATELAALIRELADDPVRRETMATHARRCAIEQFDRTTVLSEFETALLGLGFNMAPQLPTTEQATRIRTR